jgi:uncharacterized membrane protein YeiH
MDPVPLTIPLWADLLAVSIGSLQGAMFAAGFRDRKLDLLGIAIIGTATGLGGMLLERIFTRLDAVITALDALTIGLFCAIGTSKALAAGVPEVPAVFIGVVSAVGGSFVRDLLLNLPIAMMHVGSLYAVAAGVGAVIVVLLATFGVPMWIAAIVCVAVTATTRLLAVRFGWSLPEQRALSRLRFTALRRPRPRR